MSKNKTINNEQYAILAARRQSFDSMLWQTPVLSLTAQAFLFTIALGSGNSPAARIVSAKLALLTALASLQLMAKLRFYEIEDSKLLEQFENNHDKEGYLPVHAQTPSPNSSNDISKYVRLSSYKVWLITLSAFSIAALVVIVDVVFALDWFSITK